MKYAIVLLSFMVFGVTRAQSVSNCDDFLTGYKDFGFTGVALVKSHGQTICRGSMVKTTGDRFLIGSISKQFTSAAILLLVERGLLKTSDNISTYFPAFPGGNKIQVHHLLSHTSGIGEITNTRKFHELRTTPFNSLKPLIAEIMVLPSQFSPGAKWSYSNSNYILLSEIIELVSGKTWADFVQTEILTPLHMSETGFAPGKTAKLTSGHQFDRDYNLIPLEATDYYERGWANGAGGLESTVDDLASWNTSLFSGNLVNFELVSQMSSAQAIVDKNLTYGFGLFQRNDILGERVIFHGGGIPGFTSMNIYLPEKDLSIIVLSNSFDGTTTGKMAWGLLKIALGQSAEIPLKNEVILPVDQLMEKEGRYEFPDLGFTMAVRLEKATIYSSFNEEPEYKLIPTSRNDFYHRAFDLQFTFSPNLQSVNTTIEGITYIGKRIKTAP